MNTRCRIAIFAIMLVLLCATAHAAGSDRDYRRANNLFAKGKYSRAIILYQALLGDPPRTASKSALHLRIADCYFQLEDYRHARDAYRKALDGQSEIAKPGTQYWIAFSTLLMGNNKEALTEFLKIPDLYPDSGMWVSTAYYWAGRVCQRMGGEEQAAIYFSKAGGRGKSAQERFALEKAKQAKGK